MEPFPTLGRSRARCVAEAAHVRPFFGSRRRRPRFRAFLFFLLFLFVVVSFVFFSMPSSRRIASMNRLRNPCCWLWLSPIISSTSFSEYPNSLSISENGRSRVIRSNSSNDSFIVSGDGVLPGSPAKKSCSPSGSVPLQGDTSRRLFRRAVRSRSRQVSYTLSWSRRGGHFARNRGLSSE